MSGTINLKLTADINSVVNGLQSVNQKLDLLTKSIQITNSRFEQLSKNTQSASSKLEQLAKPAESARTKIVSLSAGFSILTNAAGTVISMVQKVVQEISDLAVAYSVQEKAEIRLQSTLKATQNACGMTASEMLAFADSISRVTTFSDQEIISVEQMLAATRMIGQDVVPEATIAILDMAAATGEDASNAAQRLAQALSDPAGEIESLKEAGIQLTEEQKKNIMEVQEQNGIYEAQKILLKEVSETYGGMAKAIADTDTGKLTQIRNVWEDVKEGLGEGLLNSIGPALDWLYLRLLDIKEWVDDVNSEERIKDTVNRAEGTPDFTSFSDIQLINSLHPYKRSDGGYDYRQESQEVIEAVVTELTKRGVDFPGYEEGLSDSSKNIRAWALQERERNPVYQFIVQNHNSPIPMNQLVRNNVDIAFSSRDLMDFNYYQDILNGIENLRKDENLKAPSDESPSMSAAKNNIDGWKSVNSVNHVSSIDDEDLQPDSISDRIKSYFSSNGSLSSSYQIEQINQRLLEGYRLIASGGLSDDQVKQITEINEALHEQKKAFSEAAEGSEDWKESFSANLSIASDIISQLTSINDSISDIFSSMADGAIDSLDEIQEKWDEYFTELDEKQERQRDSLNALLASGNISYQDYIDSMNALDEERADAESKAEQEKEEQRKKADELNKAAFIANQANAIANATIAGAQSIMNVWADATTPVWAKGVMTGLVTATTAAQIAAISCQQYTPLAAGGIVQSPTKALIGEGGSPEMVLPLTDSNMERFGVSGKADNGVINIIINIGNSYSGDQLSEDVFRGIERAQRTGALPKWRYTA